MACSGLIGLGSVSSQKGKRKKKVGRDVPQFLPSRHDTSPLYILNADRIQGPYSSRSLSISLLKTRNGCPVPLNTASVTKAYARQFSTSRTLQRDFKMKASLGHRAFVALGSNVGDRVEMIEKACLEMDRLGIKVRRTSSLFETAPMYVLDQAPFMNGVCEVSYFIVAFNQLCPLIDPNSSGRDQPWPNGTFRCPAVD